MYERFTSRARQAVVFAQDEATKLGVAEVGGDHLLLGLLVEQEGVAARVLTSLDIGYDKLLSFAAHGSEPRGSALPWSSNAKNVLEVSLREALSLGHNYIGTEHLLLGIVRADNEGYAALTSLGVDAETIRNEVIRQLSAGRDHTATTRVRAHRQPAQRKVDVPVKAVSQAAQIPAAAYAGDGASDLVACEEALVPAGGRALVGTGLQMAIPVGYAGLVLPRSGLAAKHGITVLNTPGLVDSGYRGEIKVILYNTGTEAFHVEAGDRIAQLMIVPLLATAYLTVEELPDSERGDGGFGSSGIKPR